MKKIFSPGAVCGAIIICLLLFASSCKKSSIGNNNGNGNGDYYVKFKANGTQKEYKSEALCEMLKLNSDGLYSAVLQGYKDYTQGAKDELGIILFSHDPFTTTLYADPMKAVKSDGSKVASIIINFNDPDGNGYLTMGPLSDENGTVPISGVVADAKLAITGLTNDYIKGTFSGTTYKSTDATFTITVLITDGEFYLPRTK